MAAECSAHNGLKHHILLLLNELIMYGTWYAYNSVSVNAIDLVSEVQTFAARAGQLSKPLRQ